MVLPVQCLSLGTVLKLYRKAIFERKAQQRTNNGAVDSIYMSFILFYLPDSIVVGPEGFEPPTKGL